MLNNEFKRIKFEIYLEWKMKICKIWNDKQREMLSVDKCESEFMLFNHKSKLKSIDRNREKDFCDV